MIPLLCADMTSDRDRQHLTAEILKAVHHAETLFVHDLTDAVQTMKYAPTRLDSIVLLPITLRKQYVYPPSPKTWWKYLGFFCISLALAYTAPLLILNLTTK